MRRPSGPSWKVSSVGLQALFYFSDHVTFDLSGRRVDLNAPIDVAALAGLDTFTQRRVLANGQLNAPEQHQLEHRDGDIRWQPITRTIPTD